MHPPNFFRASLSGVYIKIFGVSPQYLHSPLVILNELSLRCYLSVAMVCVKLQTAMHTLKQEEQSRITRIMMLEIIVLCTI